MKKLILSENGFNTLKSAINESAYHDNIASGIKYLTNNYKVIPQDNGKGSIVGVFVKIDNNIPTSKMKYKEDIIDELDRLFRTRYTNDEYRRKFVEQLLDDWYNNGITKSGNLSKPI